MASGCEIAVGLGCATVAATSGVFAASAAGVGAGCIGVTRACGAKGKLFGTTAVSVTFVTCSGVGATVGMGSAIGA